MQRLSVFYPASNERGYIQAVIHSDDRKAFLALGFSLSVDDLQDQAGRPNSQEALADYYASPEYSMQVERAQERPRRGRPPRSAGNSEE